MRVISRKAAKAAGLKYYFTGKPCKRRGHIEKRWVSSFMCFLCGREIMRDRHRRITGCSPRKQGQDPNYFKQYYAANKERRKHESQAWYHANADRALENRKVYVAANRDKARGWGRKSANTRRAILNQVFVEVVDPRVVFDRDRGVCGICASLVDPASPWEIDHVVPISKGGPHSYANVQLSHRACNRSKSARLS